jgi:DNA-binding SARP family transcriptional activator
LLLLVGSASPRGTLAHLRCETTAGVTPAFDRPAHAVECRMDLSATTGRWRLAVVGPRARLWDGADELQLGTTDAVTLAYLALAGPTARARLAALLWPDAPSARARANLRQLLHRLHRRADVVAGDPLALRANVRLVTAAELGSADLSGAEPIDELDPDRFGELAAWFAAERQRRTATALGEVERAWRGAAAADGDWESALLHAHREVAVEPQAEQGYRRMMRAQLELGRVRDALATYERCRRWLRADLDQPPDAATTALAQRALRDQAASPDAGRTLVELAWEEYQRGRSAAAEHAAIAALGALERSRDASGVAEAYFVLGSIAQRRGDGATARAWWSLALRASTTPMDDAAVLARHLNLAMVHDGLGAPDAARHHYLAALDLARALGDQRAEAIALNNLAHLALAAGRREAARDLSAAARALAEATGDARLLAAVLEGAARCAIATGDAGAGRGLAARAYLLASEHHDAMVLVEAALSLANASQALGEVSAARSYVAHAAELARRFECHEARLAAECILARVGDARVTLGTASYGPKEVDDDQAAAMP